MPEIFKQMKRNILIILSLIIFVSCNVTNKLSSIKMIDGYNYYEQASPPMKIQLFGDYCFQPFKKKYYRDVDTKFIQYVKLSVAKTKPKTLYKAHTIIQPFYSTLCLQYKAGAPDTVFLNVIKAQLKENLNVKVLSAEMIKSGFKDVYKLKYQQTNSINKVYTSHTEYLFRSNEFIYRLFFWTTNNDDTVISVEAESIIKEIRFD